MSAAKGKLVHLFCNNAMLHIGCEPLPQMYGNRGLAGAESVVAIEVQGPTAPAGGTPWTPFRTGIPFDEPGA